CDCEQQSDYFYTVGITYIYSINHWLQFETGIEYSKLAVRFRSIIPPRPPNTRSYFGRPQNYSLVDIPLTFRFNFLHYFFANTGLLIDIDASKSNSENSQNGLGQMLGVGFNYNFKAGFS